MVSDGVRERLYLIAVERVDPKGWGAYSKMVSGIIGATVDALLESGEVIPFDAANRAAVELDAEGARSREYAGELLEALRAVSDICFNEHDYRDPIGEIAGVTQPILNAEYDSTTEGSR